ncbi:hypothetical protein QNI16_35860 [Cytophagaceae bacterium YF14B1]|uniref:Uncharacterized protein n=1 Tax=Xanthocytophaga flava TaxID=3048013 RepID=A0AAE3UCW1_9BACT|nr:hypothetical protein [Xanthocytophaga flavus]MDJ1485913.1 hypothetical protein [Xanthocytophaga flavus]
MKRRINRFLAGLHAMYERIGNPEPELSVVATIVMCELVLLLHILATLRAIFNIDIPTFEQFGNKWLVRVGVAIVFWILNFYFLDINEDRYGKEADDRYSIFKVLLVLFFLLFFPIVALFLMNK